MGWFDEQIAQQSAGAPGAAAPQDPRAIFEQLTQGKPPTPETLNALEPELAKYGIRVVRNAAGVAGKIALGPKDSGAPIVDVIQGAGVGGKAWQWNSDGGGGGSLPGGYQTGMFTGGGRYPLASVMGSGLAAPWTTPFNAPTAAEMEKLDPGYDARMKMGAKALQQSAAAKGTLLTGGTLKDLNQFAQDYASNEYDKVYGRALGEYGMAHDIFRQNQGDLYGRLGGIAGMGQQAATGYGSAVAGLTQQAGQATAAGQQAAGNIYGNAIGNVGSTLGGVATMYPWYSQAGGGGGGFRAPVGQNIDPNSMFRGY